MKTELLACAAAQYGALGADGQPQMCENGQTETLTRQNLIRDDFSYAVDINQVPPAAPSPMSNCKIPGTWYVPAILVLTVYLNHF